MSPPWPRTSDFAKDFGELSRAATSDKSARRWRGQSSRLVEPLRRDKTAQVSEAGIFVSIAHNRVQYLRFCF
jgi:hypothetical protein